MELTLSLSERQLGPISGGPIDLTSARLRNAFLRFATLSEADLAGADLSHADLVHARLDRANLTAANLSGAVLDNADFTDARLARANLSGASLSNAQNLTQAQLGESIGNSFTILPPHLRVPETWISRSRSPTAASARTFSHSRVSKVTFWLFDKPSLKTAALVGGLALMLSGLIWQFGTYRLQSERKEAQVPSASAELRAAAPAEIRGDAETSAGLPESGTDAASLSVSRSNTLAERFAGLPQPHPIGLGVESSLATLPAKPPDDVAQLSVRQQDAALAVPVGISESLQEIPLVEDPPGLLTVTEVAGLDPKTSLGGAAPSSAAIPSAKDVPVGTAAARGSLRDMAVPPIPVRKPLIAKVDVMPKPVRKPFIAKDYAEPIPTKKPLIQRNSVQTKVVKTPEERQGAPRSRPKGQSFVETRPEPSAGKSSIADVLAGGL